MSKAFTREETPDAPVVVPARAPLPAGVANYVTPRGLELLRAEARELAAERLDVERAGDGAERAQALARLNRRRADLDGRIASAVVVQPPAGPTDEVRFGAEVKLLGEDGRELRYRIVGVDEAAPGDGRIAFVSPLARALLGRRAGDSATVRTPRGSEELELVAVSYPADDDG